MEPPLSILNPGPIKVEGPSQLHDLIGRSAHTNATAVEFLDAYGIRSTLSYGQLEHRSNVLSRKILRLHGKNDVDAGTPFVVPVLVAQCPDLYITLLAILKAGAAFCPLPLDVPEARLRFILQDVSASLLVTSAALKARLPDIHPITTLVIEEETHDTENDASLVSIVSTPPLAYIMYTSGSTGTPKGVCVSHEAATQALLAHDRHIPHFSRFLQFASPTFDVSVFEIFFPLFRGSTLVSCDRSRMLNDLPGVITAMSVDAAELTPSVASSLLRGRASVPSLKVLLTIGEMLNRKVVREFGGSPTQPGILHGMYGPTEAAIHCTLQTNFPEDMHVGNIGVPLDTVSAFILAPMEQDISMKNEIKILPLGEAGELAIGGHQLADGYLNRKEQTRAAFIHHPNHGRLYRTGDRARLLPSGRLECLGRIATGQVKIRGVRVELGEVEYAASRTISCRGVVAAVVSGILILFCQFDGGTDCEKRVREVCRQWLPATAMPGEVMISDSFPYLASGKVDRNALVDRYNHHRADPSSERSVRTEQSRRITSVVRGILGATVQDNTSLASAGLDSLSSIRLASGLNEAGFAQLDAAAILEARNVSDLVRLIEQRSVQSEMIGKEEYENTAFSTLRQAVLGTPLLPSDGNGIDEVLPCTPIQAAMLAETAEDHSAYCNWIELQILEDSVSRVEQALKQLARHHAMLRAGFSAVTGLGNGYATVVWHELLDDQITLVGELNHEYDVKSDVELLRPFKAQLQKDGSTTRLLLRLHHAIYDQWSVDILLADLRTLLSGTNLPVRPRFAAVATYHATIENVDKTDASLSFWSDHLADWSSTTLPNFNNRKLVPGIQRTARRSLDLDMQAVRRTSRALECSPHVMFQAAMAYIVSSYVGNSDVVYGTVFSGRTIPVAEVENIFGPCLATLPSRIDLCNTRTLRDLAKAVHQSNRAMLKHSTTPLAAIKKACLCPPGTPLFDTLFVWQESSHSTSGESDVIKYVDSADYLEFSMTLELEPTVDDLLARVTYAQGVLPSGQVELFLQHITHIVRQFCVQPDTNLEEVAVNMPSELLSMANLNPTCMETGDGLAALIERQAQADPRAPAVLFASTVDTNHTVTRSFSYEELNNQSNRLAHCMLDLGVLPDAPVCICMEKSPELYVSILATIKAGAGYLPLTPDTPLSRVQGILKTAGIKLCLCDDQSSSMLSSLGSLHLINVPAQDLTSWPISNLELPYVGSHLAYTIFTSGTTGVPKGVQITNDNLLSNLLALSETYPVRKHARLLQACSQAFDVSVFEIFFTFVTGMCLCSATKDELFRDLELSIRQLGVTHLSLTPTVTALVNPINVPTVEFLVTAGEAVTAYVHQKWAGKGFYQGYGPSETTNICTINPRVSVGDMISNIGPPLKNTSAFVLSSKDSFKVLPAGAIGELAFGGQQVFRGYLNMDELNTSIVVQHPEYGRVYRSGDLGRILPDGTLQISGRTDDQVKIRGQRVELNEVNSAILKHHPVSECVTLLLQGQEEQLVSFWTYGSQISGAFAVVTADERVPKIIQELYSILDQTLPAYMAPSALIAVSRLPLTAQGKLDKRRLEAQFQQLKQTEIDTFARPSEDASTSKEWSTDEETLAKLLAQLLTIPANSISRYSSFFGLGLDSIKAIRFAKTIEAHMHVIVPITQILKQPNIARLARYIAKNNSKEAPRAAALDGNFSKEFKSSVQSDFKAGNRETLKILPCTPLQEAMLSVGSDSTQRGYYNVSVLQIVGDIRRLKESFTTMVARHDILRTCFVSTDDARYPYAQVVLTEQSIPWTDISSDEDDLDPLLQCNRAHLSIDWRNHEVPYLIRVLSNEKATYLLLAMHHALYDGISMDNMFEEIEAVYHGRDLPSAVQFEDFLQERLLQNSKEADIFWSSQLRGFIPCALTRSQTRAPAGCGVRRQALDVSFYALEALSKRQKISMLSIYQAAWSKVLSICQGVEDICFGNVVSGRTVPVGGVDRLVAPCFNTLPVRIDLGAHHSNLSLLKTLHQSNIDAMPYQLTPLRRIQSLTRKSFNRLFESLILVQPQSRPLDRDIWCLERDEGAMEFPLIVEVSQQDNEVGLQLHFDLSLLSGKDADKLCSAFASALQSCVENLYSEIQIFPRSAAITGLLQSHETTEGSNLHPYSTAAWSSTEAQVREVFATLSRTSLDHIDKDITMYRLGLDSLNSAQVAMHLRKRGIQVSAADVMENPTCSGLAAVSRSSAAEVGDNSARFDFDAFENRNREVVCDALNLEHTDVEKVRPCTQVQAGMLTQSFDSDGKLYVNHMVYEIPTSLSASELRRAWEDVQRKQQSLRMGFASTDEVHHAYMTIVYHASSSLLPWLMLEANPDFEKYQQQTNADIVSSLHKPAWRIAIASSAGKQVMILSAHHALYDAETLRLILGDLGSALRSQPLGAGLDFDGVLLSILDGAEDVDGMHESFWKQYLTPASVTRFPSLTPRSIRLGNGRTVSSVSNISRIEIETQSQSLGVTIQSLGQVAWAQLLAAYTGDEAVTFGTVLSGRTIPGSDGVAFPCITTVPVVCNTAQPVQAQLQDLLAFNASVQRHQFTPLTNIHRYAGSSDQSLFDSLFVYQKFSSSINNDFNWRLVQESAAVDYSVSLEFNFASDDRLCTQLTFNTGILPEKQAELLLRQYEVILLGLLQTSTSKPSRPDSTIYSIQPPREPEISSKSKFLHHMVEKAAHDYPDRIALEFVTGTEGEHCSSQIWTYKQLEEQANRIAHVIRRQGVQPGSIVALCMDKCAEASIAFLGILKAQCAFLALDPELPGARKKFILEDSGSKLLLTTSKLINGLRSQAEITMIEVDQIDYTRLSSQAVLYAGNPRDTCYVLYTSGTTGEPKGCEITHENAVQAMLAFQVLFSGHWDMHSKWLQFASYWFDVSILEQFWSWGVGIRVVGAPRDIVLGDLQNFIRTHGITHLDLTPSLARLLNPEEVPSLCKGVFITGGEALKQEILDVWGSKGVVCNGYGPTEATIGVTMYPFVGPDVKPSNIGWQFPNVGTYVLRPGTEEPVLRGALGELCVSGRLVGKGYLNRPELTERQFPHVEKFGERLYRTGDLVRVVYDESFLFAGRQDAQAKLRGQRLELGEVDAVIRQSSNGIADVASLVIKSSQQNKQLLVSFIAGSDNKEHPTAEILQTAQSRATASAARTVCEERLPAYMVPMHILSVSKLPLTVNNKVDSKRLAAMYGTLTVEDLNAMFGTSKTQRSLSKPEQKIRDVLEESLSLDLGEAHPETNLFTAGLDSISASAFARRLKKAGFQHSDVGVIVSNPTLKRLAKALSTSHDEDSPEVDSAKMRIAACEQRYRHFATARLAIPSDAIGSIAPCTPLQQGLLYESIKTSRSAYFNDFRYVLKDISLLQLESAWQKLVDETEILRTIFLQTDEGHIQVVLRNLDTPWIETSAHKGKSDNFLMEKKTAWRSANEHDFVRPFEVVIVRSAANTIMVVHMHHAVYDGISWDLLMRRLVESYGGRQTSKANKSFLRALPYGPLQSQPGAKDFWSSQLAKRTGSSLSRLAENEIGRSATARISFDDPKGLERVRRELAVSYQALIQACWMLVLQEVNPQIDTIGIIVSGRSINYDGADSVIGPMFNTVPFHIRPQPAETWKSLIMRCQEFNGNVITYQHTPLRDIQRWCGRGDGSSLFDTIFVFQNDSILGEDEKHWTPVESEAQPDYPLALDVTLGRDGGLRFLAAAQSHIADEKILQRMLARCTEALRTIVAEAHAAIADTMLLSNECIDIPDSAQPAAHPNLKRVAEFAWTDEALAVRQEIAKLAEVPDMNVDEHTSILAVGLDSIDAVKLSSRLRKVGLVVPVSAIMRAQTIPRIIDASKVEVPKSVSSTTGHVLKQQDRRIRKALEGFADFSNVERVLPATPGQEALLTDMIRSGFREYYNHDVLRVVPETKINKLMAAWQYVVDASEILRTSFVEVASPDIDATFAQVIHRPSKLEVDTVCLENGESLEVLFESIRSEVSTNHQQKPPMRLTLVRAQRDQHLILSLAHAQYDGYSLALLHDDVQRVYRGQVVSRPSNDVVLCKPVNNEAEQYWRSFLAGATISPFPLRAHLQRNSIMTIRSQRVSGLSANDARGFCRKESITLQALGQTCWSLVLAQHLSIRDVTFGVVLACRITAEAQNILFPTMNTVVMRAVLHGSRREMLRHIQGINGDMLAFQDTPLRTIQRLSAGSVATAVPSSAGLFDTLFIYQQRPDTISEQKPLYESVSGASEVEYPVAVEMEVCGEDVVLRAACKDNVLDTHGVATLLKQLDDVLCEMVRASEEPTVQFDGDTMSICALPPTTHKSASPVDLDRHDSLDEDADEADHWSDRELTIRTTLAKVARVPEDDISRTSTIENIGIDSISAIKVAALLRDHSIKLSVSEILRAKTTSKMAKSISDRDASTAQSAVDPERIVGDYLRRSGLQDIAGKMGVDPRHVESIWPATAGQTYMLRTWRLSDGQLFYPTFEYQLRGAGTTEAVYGAWQALVTRNPILRTVFCTTGNADIPILQLVLKKASESFQDSNSENAPISMEADQPMISLTCVEKDDGYLLRLKIHHALYDAVSLPLLIHDFESLLNEKRSLPATTSFPPFLALGLSDQTKHRRRQFWTQYLRDLRPIQLQQPSCHDQQRRIELFKPNAFMRCDRLVDLAKKEGVTLQALVFAAYSKIYASFHRDGTLGQDVVVGIYLSNRSHLEDLSDLRAPTLNLVPLAVRSPVSSSLLGLAKQVQADLQTIGSAENSSASLWEIHQWTGVKVDTFVNYLKLPDTEPDEQDGVAGDRVTLEELSSKRKQERSIVVEPEGGKFGVPKELEGLTAMAAYQHSLDIEATVAAGTLNVGVFCPEEMLDLQSAGAVVRDLSAAFTELVD